MPFYLAIQTSLIEADDEEAAARIAVDQIQSGNKVAVTVKSDETTVSHIVVPARPAISLADPVADPDAGGSVPATAPAPTSVVEADRKATLKRMMADALSLLRRRTKSFRRPTSTRGPGVRGGAARRFARSSP